MTATTPFSTTLTVPTRHVKELMARLAPAGFTLLDTGERVATDDGLDAEAMVHLVHLPTVECLDADAVPLGVPR
jgi:hypothetical protein